MATLTEIKKVTDPTDRSKKGFGCKTILFNCNCHSFDEVERQLIKAIRCSLSQARNIAWKVHTAGHEVVYEGHKERCEAVAMVLEDIGLLVKVSE
jgi:ATP-dependent Clp protease adapter protein ClpS